MRKQYIQGTEEVIEYEIVVKIPNDKLSVVEKFPDYETACSRYLWLETDCRNLLLSLNEIKRVTVNRNWIEGE